MLDGAVMVSDEARDHINALRKKLHVSVETHLELLRKHRWTIIEFLDGAKSTTEA